MAFPAKLADRLRAVFFAKDRSVILADDCWIEGENITPGVDPKPGRGQLYWDDEDRCWTQKDTTGTEKKLCTPDWQDWTPTVTQSGNVTVTVTYARYAKIGDVAIVEARLAVTGSGTANNAIIIGGQPAAIQHGNTNSSTSIIGSGIIVDAGTAFYQGGLISFGATDWRFIGHNLGSVFGVTPNFGLASGDAIGLQAAFEAT